MTIAGKTTVFGVIGDPVEHTRSPMMHNAAIEHMGLDAVYVPFRVTQENMEKAVRGMAALGIRGLNVTIPYKTRVAEFLDCVSDEAQAVGSVNTITNDNGILVGDNTDVYGFIMALTVEGGFSMFPEKVCVIGAGGAARSIVYACAMRAEVAEITVMNRTLSKAEHLADDLSPITGKSIRAVPLDRKSVNEILPTAGLVVNTTSVGMYPECDISPVTDTNAFHSGQVVYDIIYTPIETKFLREAKLHGAATIGGLGMLAYQGARSLTLWTGKEAPVQVMLEVLKKHVENCPTSNMK